MVQASVMTGGPHGVAGTASGDLPLDAGAFRQVVGRYATGVVIVTTQVDGVDHVMTANSFTSVSLDPLLVLFCVAHDARFRPAVLESEVWGISIAATAAQPAAAWFARRGRPLPDQIAEVPHHRGVSGVALMDQALGWLECRTVAVHPAGDHDIVIGAVSRISTPPQAGIPLIYWAGGYHHGTGSPFTASEGTSHEMSTGNGTEPTKAPEGA